MEQEKKKSNLKIIIPIAIAIVVISVIGILISGNESKEFKEVAHICNDLGGLPGMQITSPKVVDVWYFEEDDHSAKDVIVCFTGENTSSNYYQYFLWQNGESIDFLSLCYAKDEVHSSNIVMKNSSASQETMLNCAGLMLQAMENGHKFENNQIEKINKMLNSKKIDKYKDYRISQ